MPTTTSRLLSVLSLLQARRDWPGAVLAERLGVSHRTVRRDIDRLREMGYSIHATMGPDGGYRLDAGAQLPPLLFDDDQVIALAVALQAAPATGVGIDEAAARALATVRQVMPSRLRHRLDAVSFETLGRRPGEAAADAVLPAVLLALSAAVRSHEVLRFDYAPAAAAPAGSGVGATDPVAARRVEPHHLVTSRGRWYLVAWDLERDDWRIFRADRITPRTPTGPRFRPRQVPGGDAGHYLAARFAGATAPTTSTATPKAASTAASTATGTATFARAVGWPCVGKVVLHRGASEVLPYAGDGVVEDLGPGRCSLESGSWSWVALAASLNLFDTDVDVVGPAELRAAFATLADRNAASNGRLPGSRGGAH